MNLMITIVGKQWCLSYVEIFYCIGFQNVFLSTLMDNQTLLAFSGIFYHFDRNRMLRN